jgi:hypothetical protein
MQRYANEIVLRDRAFAGHRAQPVRLSSAIRTDFGVKVVSAIESLCGGRWS